MGVNLVQPSHSGWREDTPWTEMDSVEIPSLPTEMEQIKALINDPYGWVQEYFDYRERDDAPDVEDMPDPYKKLVRVSVTPGKAHEAWAQIADCGTDALHIPRHLRWSTLPRSREYMNMEKPYDELCRRYWRPALLVLPLCSSGAPGSSA